jgi:hypothetical protein
MQSITIIDIWAYFSGLASSLVEYAFSPPLSLYKDSLCGEQRPVRRGNEPTLTPAANLPPLSTTLAKMVAKFATGVIDTGDKFAADVIDTVILAAILLLVSLIPVANLPPVS